MSPATRMPARALPHGVSAAAVLGWLGGAAAWVSGSQWNDTSSLLTTFSRVDQVSMLLLGACVGASVLAGRARHRRESVPVALLAGLLLGGAPAIVGATLAQWLPIGITPRAFLWAREAAWGMTAALVATGLASFTRSASLVRVGESALLALIGGVTSGALFSLPGPAELWLPVAMSWFGATVGAAAIGPGLWGAPAVVQTLPTRGHRRGLHSLYERSIDNGWSMNLAEARVGCVENRVYLYPPPGGALVDGHAFYRPLELMHDALVTVGRARYRVIVARWRT